jgi:hypothetical protein
LRPSFSKQFLVAVDDAIAFLDALLGGIAFAAFTAALES